MRKQANATASDGNEPQQFKTWLSCFEKRPLRHTISISFETQFAVSVLTRILEMKMK
jgi:hypothetical protein